MKCKHKWVDMEDGSLDKFCVRCSKKAMQAQLSMPIQAAVRADIREPAARKTVEIPLFTGDSHIRIEAYEDEIKKSIMKKLGIPGINMRVSD